MPVVDTVKPSEGAKKKTTENSADGLSKNRSGRIRDSSDDNQSRGDDLSPPRVGSSKKSATKKGTNDNPEKRVKTPVIDKVPKKSIQRAKGSMTLNKTIEAEEKKKRLTETEEVNHNSMTALKDAADGVKVKIVRSKPKQSIRSNRPESDKKVPLGQKKNWTTVAKKESEAEMKEESTDPVAEEPKTGEIQTEGVPLSSCSFFEKLQQGLRAYFASRNSLTDEKPKKKVTEGGAGVGKGGKEETKEQTQENKINNKIKNLDSDLFYDRPRLKSNSEGQTNNFLNKKPKILECVKRKKLYHPKKHYVSIQIPRKGYFYRSFEFRPSQSATSSVNDRLESTSLPTKSEIQIARMASTSPKGSDIHKKRITKSRKKTSDAVQGSDEFSLVYNYLEAINFILNQQMVAQNFEKEVNRMALNWPIEISITPEGVTFLTTEKNALSLENLDFEGDKQFCTAAENSSSPNNSAMKIQKCDDGIHIESTESYTILETEMQNSSPVYTTPTQSEFKPDPSFDILMNYLRESLGKEQRYGDLEISPIMMTNEDFKSDPASKSSPKFENITDTFGEKTDIFDRNLLNPLEEKFCVATAFCEYKKVNPLKLEKSQEQFAKILIGDIDLHSELQNYSKETKNRGNNETENISNVLNQNNQFFDLNKTKSFLSETDFDFTPQRDTSHARVHFDLNPEIKPLSEENIKMRVNEDLSSYMTNGMRKIRWEIDSKELPRETGGCIKQTNGTIPESDLNEKEKLVSQLVSLLFKKHNEQPGDVLDCYEKVSPMKTVCRAKKNKSKLLLSNSIDSMPAKSESDHLEKNENVQPDVIDQSKKETEVNNPSNGKKWCPTLDELAEIYGCVLKHNSKKKSSKKKSRDLWSSTIMSILRDKLHEKQNKMNLINFTKTLKECFKPPSDWKSGTDQNKNKKLQEYVNMFQEVLLSSLSIEQITYLNNVISQLQEQETASQCFNFEKDQESTKSNSSGEIGSENEAPNPPVALPQKVNKKEESNSAKHKSAAVQLKTCLKEKSSGKKIAQAEKSKQVALSPPAELESVLKSTFNSKNVGKGSKSVDKILVNVKLCGSRVLVNDFSYIRDERTLCPRPGTRNKVSELILENIRSDKLGDDSTSDLNVTPSRSKKTKKRPIKKAQNIKIIVKSSKSSNRKRTKKLKNKNSDRDEKPQTPKEKANVDRLKISKSVKECTNDSSVETVIPDESEPLRENKNSFEYDQERLKVQHPIDAIIETSESKIIEHAESAENIDRKEEPSEATKSAKKIEVTEVKEALNSTTSPRLFSKDLLCDLRWTDEIRKDLLRTRSQNRDNTHVKKGAVDNFKFLDDLQYKPKNVEKKNKKTARQHNTYFCYPSLILQDKSMKKKKAKDADSRVCKARSSKAVKKTDTRVIKATSSKTVKKTDSKGVKKTNSKTVKKKDGKESVKKSEVLPSHSCHSAASETLANDPEMFFKSNSIRSNQSENVAQSSKAPANMTPNAEGWKNSADSVLFFRMKGPSDIGSETSSFNASTGSSHLEEMTKHRQKQQSENSIKSTSSSDTMEMVDKYKNGPIVIFSTPDDSDDVTSQFAMIRSDSILKTLSHPLLNQNKIDSVFKSHSDVKFYPGRVSDSTEEQQPWVTFILTLQQEAKADLPPNQVKVVDKRRLFENQKQEAGEDAEDEDSENDQIPLNSIEKFMDELRENRLKVMRRQKELEKRKSDRKKLSSSARVKQKIKWSSWELSRNAAVKRHDCQKNKTKINFIEARRNVDRKNAGSETILAKVIVNMLQFLLDGKGKRLKNGKQFRKNRESESSETDLNNDAGGKRKAVGKWQRKEKTTSELLSAVINGVTKFEKVLKMNKLIYAIKAELTKRAENPGANAKGLLELSKKIDAIKSLQNMKVSTIKKNSRKEASDKRPSLTRTTEEVKPFGSVECKEEEAKVLGRKPSTYFDAEDMVKGEIGGCVKELEYQSGEPFAKTVLEPPGGKEKEAEDGEEAHPKLKLTSSDENLFSTDTICDETEEIIFSKIYKNLEKNNVSYSMALFDSLLRTKGILDKDKKLQDVFQTINQKNKNLMTDIEKSAWMKLHFLLDEVSRLYDLEADESATASMYHYVTNQLSKTSGFIGNIQVIKKVTDMPNFLSRSDFRFNNVFSGLLNRLARLKNTLVPRITSLVMRFFEEEHFRNDSGCDVHTVKAAHDFYNAAGEKESQLQFLKNQIRDQRLFIEYLVNTGSSSTSSEISDIKNRVSEKIMVLEKSMSSTTRDEDVGRASEESLPEPMTSSLSLGEIRSYLSLNRVCRSLGMTHQNTWNLEACE